MDTEKDNSLPFLEIAVSITDTEFCTSLFRKKPFTGLYTDFANSTPKE